MWLNNAVDVHRLIVLGFAVTSTAVYLWLERQAQARMVAMRVYYENEKAYKKGVADGREMGAKKAEEK